MTGRPSKTTVDYFPHFTAHKKTIFTLESLYGNDGYAFWFKLLEILGSTEGHCFRYGKSADWLFLVAKTNISEEKALLILKTLSDLEAIDPRLHKEKAIWSDNFVDGLRHVYDKRSTEIPLKPPFRGEKRLSGKKTPQSKVKESKVKKYGPLSNVVLSDEEMKKLITRFNSSCQEKIDTLSEYIASKGVKYKSHYATILAWDRRDKKKSKQPGAISCGSCRSFCLLGRPNKCHKSATTGGCNEYTVK